MAHHEVITDPEYNATSYWVEILCTKCPRESIRTLIVTFPVNRKFS